MTFGSVLLGGSFVDDMLLLIAPSRRVAETSMLISWLASSRLCPFLLLRGRPPSFHITIFLIKVISLMLLHNLLVPFSWLYMPCLLNCSELHVPDQTPEEYFLMSVLACCAIRHCGLAYGLATALF
jgi:hypothetical protein